MKHKLVKLLVQEHTAGLKFSLCDCKTTLLHCMCAVETNHGRDFFIFLTLVHHNAYAYAMD